MVRVCPRALAECGLTEQSGTNQFVELSRSGRSRRVRYGGEEDLSSLMRLPVALTRTAAPDQPHNMCVDSMPGVAEGQCLQATDYNQCVSA